MIIIIENSGLGGGVEILDWREPGTRDVFRILYWDIIR